LQGRNSVSVFRRADLRSAQCTDAPLGAPMSQCRQSSEEDEWIVDSGISARKIMISITPEFAALFRVARHTE
jgi:hypothetical protein